MNAVASFAPTELRLMRDGQFTRITVVWGLLDTNYYSVKDWRAFLMKCGWMSVPRIWY